ncbi:MAG: hypothetical protein EPN97_01205 [Alphaproteobacteria bacterium]|nr:MAG: hypothetical protein EPN97_01205 [Alphaproteobacteria bacterium]
MKHFIHINMAVFALVAALCLAPATHAEQFRSVADKPGSSSSGSGDPTLDAFKGMSEKDRNEILNQALETYRNMSPEQKQSLVEQATALNSIPGMAATGAEWEKLLSPEQKKMISAQIEPSLKTDPAQNTAAPTQQATMAALLAQIRNLPPNEQQTILNALKGQNAATPAPAVTATTTAAAPVPAAPPADPCAEYKTANPAFYANCTKRMNPTGAK